jgi:hypothetical protein
MMAKTFSWSLNVPCGGASSFDLISPDRTVGIPSKRAEYFVRMPGEEPIRVDQVGEGVIGYGLGREEVPPTADRFHLLLDRVIQLEANELLPMYLIDPSISKPKRPFAVAEG